MNTAKTKLWSDKLWVRPFKNAGILLLGRGTQAILSIAYLALATRALGLENFGYLVLIHGLALTAAQIIRFQTWQAVLSFGAKQIKEDDTDRFNNSISFSVWLDILSSVAGVIILQAFIPRMADWLHIPLELVPMVRIYVLGIVILILTSVPEGLLKLFDRHDLISVQTIIEPVIRFAGALFLFSTNGALINFIWLWLIALIAGRLAGIYLSIALLKQKDLLRHIDLSIKHFIKPENGLWRFVIGTNISTSLNINNHQLATVLCGWLLGPSGAGLYRVGQQISNIISKPASKLLTPAIYTDMAELSASGEHHKSGKVILQTSIIALGASGLLFTILVFGGKYVITLIAGEEYINAYPVMITLAVAGLLQIIAFPLEPMLVSAQRIKETVITKILAISLYCIAFIVLASSYDLIGAGLAMITYSLVNACLLWIFSARYLMSVKAASQQTTGATN